MRRKLRLSPPSSEGGVVFHKFLLLGSLAAAAVVIRVARARREKVIGREFDLSEGVAGTVGGIVTLLFGYAEIVYRNQHLNISYELNYREKPQGGINGRRAVLQLGDRIAAEHLAYAFRNAADILLAIVNFADSRRKRNRIDRLNHAFRHIRASARACVAVSVLSVAA